MRLSTCRKTGSGTSAGAGHHAMPRHNWTPPSHIQNHLRRPSYYSRSTHYSSPGLTEKYPRLQILTVAELLEGKKLAYPRLLDATFKNRIHRWLEQVTAGAPREQVEASGEDGLAVQEVIEAAIRSIEGGTVEQVPAG